MWKQRFFLGRFLIFFFVLFFYDFSSKQKPVEEVEEKDVSEHGSEAENEDEVTEGHRLKYKKPAIKTTTNTESGEDNSRENN